jgi:hypothetical protein
MVENLNTIIIYCGILILENIGTAANYHGIFKALAPGVFNKKYLYVFNIWSVTTIYKYFFCLFL